MAFGFITEIDLQKLGVRKAGKNICIAKTVDLVGIENMEFGDNVVIEGFCIVAALGDKPVIFGSHIHVNAQCLISGQYGITMEDFTGLSAGTRVFSSSDDYSGATLTNPCVDDQFKQLDCGAVTIKKHAIIGANSVIMPGVTIGEGVAVGTLSFVNRDCEPWGIYSGTPAKRVKERKRDLLKQEPKFLKWYAEVQRKRDQP